MIGSAALFSLSSCPRLHPGPRDPEHPRADTRRVVAPNAASPAFARCRGRRRGSAASKLVCACTHYLVFKEPTVAAALSSGPSPLELSSREPFKVTTATRPCQALFIGPHPFRLAAAPTVVRLGNLTSLLSLPALVNPSFAPRRRRLIAVGKSRGPETTIAPVFWSSRPPSFRWVTPEAEGQYTPRARPCQSLRLLSTTILKTCCCCFPLRRMKSRPPIACSRTTRSRSFVTRRLFT